MNKEAYLIGVDFGTDSARAIIVDGYNGKVMGEAYKNYERWCGGKYQNPDISMYRQHPLDYIEAFEASVCAALDTAGEYVRKNVLCISIDTTGSTPCPVNEYGTPLALLDEFRENENAMFHLWKDHTAIEEAIEINKAFSDFKGINYTRYQGTYSSEWYWAKILHTSRIDNKVKDAAYSWVEHCDWLTGLLVGEINPTTMYRSSCAAGHKALWHSTWGGLPATECFNSIDPYLAHVAKTFGRNVQPADCLVGRITEEWAESLGVPKDTIIGGTSFDAHAGAVGAGIRKNVLVTNVGTSSVDMMVEDARVLEGKNLVYACGQAENSIVPGYIGLETGQAAFGDVYAWFRKLLMWPIRNMNLVSEKIAQDIENNLISAVTKRAEKLELSSAATALDWLNGRRYPNANEMVKSALYGLTLGTDAPEIFQALVLATVFGFKRIVDSFENEGIQINEIIAVGGITKKSPYIMQTMADVLRRKINVSASTQACARGAAIYAATSCGLYESIEKAQDSICEGYIKTYVPNIEKREAYIELYNKYCALGAFVEDSAK
jgi:L-ribulokinase